MAGPGPKSPPVQTFLKQALDWQAYLSERPGLTQSALAKDLGMNRVRVTQILNLLRLAPEIQRHILELPLTTKKRGAITETSLRPLVGLSMQEQVEEFQRPTGEGESCVKNF